MSTVAVLDIPAYGAALEEQLLDGFRAFSLEVRGKRVLLKPNLVWALPGPVTTDSRLVGAAAAPRQMADRSGSRQTARSPRS